VIESSMRPARSLPSADFAAPASTKSQRLPAPPTIYAKFHSKEALLTAVIERVLRRNAGSCDAAVIENRLKALAVAILTAVLATETNGLIRVAVAEARRFPDLAARLGRVSRERQVEAVTRLIAEFAESDPIEAPPAFAPDRLPSTARRLLDLTVSPMVLRALLGENLSALRPEIGPQSPAPSPFFSLGAAAAATRRNAPPSGRLGPVGDNLERAPRTLAATALDRPTVGQPESGSRH
jgi:AcrR family transcriptional regulator